MRDDKTTFRVVLRTAVLVNATKLTSESDIAQRAIEIVDPSDWDVEDIEEVYHEFED